jgi:hypothetical protein
MAGLFNSGTILPALGNDCKIKDCSKNRETCSLANFSESSAIK